MGFFKKNRKLLLTIVVALALVYYFKPGLFEGMYGGSCGSCADQVEQFCGDDGDNEIGYPYGDCADSDNTPPLESFSSCYQRKQIYHNSCDPDEPSGHADVNLERRFGKLYININANLPYAKGGVYNSAWGNYHAFLVDTRNTKSINLGSLVRDGSRFYKLSTDLLGEYSNYDEIVIYRQTEDNFPKKILSGSLSQNCSSL